MTIALCVKARLVSTFFTRAKLLTMAWRPDRLLEQRLGGGGVQVSRKIKIAVLVDLDD
jgi:hypothetical protein